jgi:hypothetical protein
MISKNIDRQVLGLATTIAWYNHHHLIIFPTDNLFESVVCCIKGVVLKYLLYCDIVSKIV